jgi:hypothetical protein
MLRPEFRSAIDQPMISRIDRCVQRDEVSTGGPIILRTGQTLAKAHTQLMRKRKTNFYIDHGTKMEKRTENPRENPRENPKENPEQKCATIVAKYNIWSCLQIM